MSKLTLEEWAVAYDLAFGRRAVRYTTMQKDEREFINNMADDLRDTVYGHTNVYILLISEYRRWDNERAKKDGGVRPVEV